MNKRIAYAPLLAFVATSILVSGCTPLSGRYSESISGKPVVIATKEAEFNSGKAVVAITFIASVDPAAKKELLARYVDTGIAREQDSNDPHAILTKEKYDSVDAEKNFEQLMAKTAGHAVTMYEHFSRKGGAVNFILDPVTVSHSPEKGLHYTRKYAFPQRDAEIDFTAYVHPANSVANSVKNNREIQSTFAGKFVPIAAIRVSKETKPATAGIVALSDKMDGTAAFTDEWAASAGFISYLNGRKDTAVREMITNGKTRERPVSAEKVIALPLMGLEYSMPKVNNGAGLAEFSSGYYDGYYNILGDALNGLNFTGARLAQISAYEVAMAPANPDIKMVSTVTAANKHDQLKKLAVVELSYLAKRDQEVASQLLQEKNWAKSIASVSYEESAAVGKYEAARAQAGMGMLMAVAGGAMAVGGARYGNTYAMTGGGGIMALGITTAIMGSTEASAIDASFKAAYDKIYQKQMEFSVDTFDGEIVKVRVSSLDDLREKLKAVYQKKVFGIQPGRNLL